MALAGDRHRHDESAGATPLDTLQALCADDLVRVNALILRSAQSDVALIPRVAGHIIAAGGKRLRPLMTLASARMCGHDGARHLGLAAVVEFIHTATLLHDDVVDGSELRRGLDTANAVWGNKPSVLVGDFLFSRAFQLMVSDGSLHVLQVLADAAATIAEGEVRQIVTANNTQSNEADYLAVVEAKTAALFAAACRIGAVVADRPAAEEDALARFGLNFGIAYQLVDDALDYAAEPSSFGKSVGDDFRDGKITLPVVLAIQRGGDDERAFWRRTLEDLDQAAGDFDHALALLNKHGAVVETTERARIYAKDARRELAQFEDNAYRQALLDVVDFCVNRAY